MKIIDRYFGKSKEINILYTKDLELQNLILDRVNK